eukprot:9191257-Ditylum_brightwellii.AAC.1
MKQKLPPASNIDDPVYGLAHALYDYRLKKHSWQRESDTTLQSVGILIHLTNWDTFARRMIARANIT